jgi:hypothetical protein
MSAATAGGVSRRGFLLALAAVGLAGVRERLRHKPLDDADVRQMAAWAG